MPRYDDHDLLAVGQRIEEVLDQFQALGGSSTPFGRQPVDLAEDLVRIMTQFYGAGLERIMEIVGSTGSSSAPGTALDRICGDSFLTGLLVLHDLHPKGPLARLQDALDGVRPYLGSHGGDIEVVDLDLAEGAVHLRMLGSCDGCPSSSVTLEYAVEQAILDAVPEISHIEVEEASSPKGAGSESVSIPVQLTRKPPSAGGGGTWVPVYGLHGLTTGRMQSIEVEGFRVFICRVGNDLYAYRDVCASCAGSFGDGLVHDSAVACPRCGARFDVRDAGRAVDRGAAGLEPVPLLHDERGIRLAVPAGSVA